MNRPLIYYIFLVFVLSLSAGFNVRAGEAGTTGLSADGQIFLSPDTLYDFKEVYLNMHSDVQFYEVWAENIADTLYISVDDPFRISLQCNENFENMLELTPENGAIQKTRIYVRMFPDALGEKHAEILHQALNATPASIPVSGKGIESMIPEHYYTMAVAGGRRLKSQLYNIIKDHTPVTYASIWDHFETTDATFSGHVWDMYSDLPCEPPPYRYTFVEDQDRGAGGNSENQFFNREHSMPLSWFGGQQTIMATDLFHIFPTDKWVNSQRGNYPYGEVSKPTSTTLNGSKRGNNVITGYSGMSFEPIDAYKGDLARAYFYMITRYEDEVSQWNFSSEGNNMLAQNVYPGYNPWVVNMLIKWHRNDPVSQKEIRRNHAVYQVQGNRNPFIDHPEFVERIWADTTTRVNEHLAGQGIHLYPNPAKNQVHIESSENIQTIEIIAVSGNRMLINGIRQTRSVIDISTLRPGLYIVRIQTDHTIHATKLQVQW
jgi:endonuclease I